MNPLDIALAGILALAALLGVLKGAARIVAGLAGLLVAAWAAHRFAPVAARLLVDNGAPQGGAGIAAYVVIFAVVVGLFAVAGWLATRGLAAAALGWVNRLAGAAAGLVLGILLGAGLVLATAALLGGDAPLFTRSHLAEPVLRVGGWLASAAPESVRGRVARERDKLAVAWRAQQK